MELAHQQRVIAVIHGDGHDGGAVNVHRRPQRRLKGFGALYRKPFGAEGFGIDFKIHRAELNAGEPLVFFSS